ncbi:hypothetical protein AA21952_3301 [Acetobacter oeni LMG 21952]|nr:hypothetical protein AA21952_3301 [Acetobacter oeni LMG 21952]
MPADVQTFFNPLGDIPLYVLGTGILSGYPRVFAGVQGIWYGLLAGVVFSLLRRLAGQGGFSRSEFFVALLIGLTGAAALSQAGLSSNEVPLAALVLSGLRLVISRADVPGGRCEWRILAGSVCVGLAAGIKPTAIVYLPAIVAASGVMVAGKGRLFYGAAISAAGGLAGFLVTYGWWGFHLWCLTGNPVFPMYNEIFHSDYAAWLPFTDQRYKPRSVVQWIAWPFFWLQDRQGIALEAPFADGRFALTMLACIWLIFRGRMWRRVMNPSRRAEGAVLAFAVVGYVFWLRYYSILRYAIPIEVLTGFLIVSALRDMFRHGTEFVSSRRCAVACFGIVVALAVTTRYPGFGHTRFSGRTFDVAEQSVEPGSTVVLMGRNLAYLAPFFRNAASLHFIGMNDLLARSAEFGAGREARGLMSGGRVLYMVRSDDGTEDDHASILKQFVPDFRVSGCRFIVSGLGRTTVRDGEPVTARLSLCRVLREGQG